jgi:uncharacterized protein involved in type VI secretion and phage assembly
VSEYYGTYRGTVAQNIDPMQLGRVMVTVPAVTGDSSLNWAMPSVPFAGSGVGLWAIPPMGANVWVNYEGGNADYPIWTGCFWGTGEVPATPAIAQQVVLKTSSCTLTLSDIPGVGGVTIELKTGMKIALTQTGLEITDGQGATIKLQGPTVSVNNGALEVT